MFYLNENFMLFSIRNEPSNVRIVARSNDSNLDGLLEIVRFSSLWTIPYGVMEIKSGCL